MCPVMTKEEQNTIIV